MYKEENFSDIELKPWQLFTDKQHLRDVVRDYCIQCGFSIIVITANNSNGGKGIENALANHWPKCDRRVCCKHLSKNWKRKFPGPLMLSLFWRACGAYSIITFRKAMQTLQKVNPKAREWLADLGEQSAWTKHKFSIVVACDVNKSNFVESFNDTLGIDRCRLVLTLLESIRRVTMVRMATRRQMCEE